MSQGVADDLMEAVAELRLLFPEWRLGQTLVTLVTAAGGEKVKRPPRKSWHVTRSKVDNRLVVSVLVLGELSDAPVRACIGFLKAVAQLLKDMPAHQQPQQGLTFVPPEPVAPKK